MRINRKKNETIIEQKSGLMKNVAQETRAKENFKPKTQTSLKMQTYMIR